MTDSQRRRRNVYDTLFRPSPSGVRHSFERLVSQIPSMWDTRKGAKLVLRTDDHRAYPAAIAGVPALAEAIKEGRFIHSTYSSKLERTVFNPLFSVNYYDRELRKDIAAYRRESTCYTRNTASGLLRFCCHQARHNYQKDYRIKGAEWKGITHGERAGIDGERIAAGMERLFVERPFPSRLKVTQEQSNIWLKRHTTPLKEGHEYIPRYAAVGFTQASENKLGPTRPASACRRGCSPGSRRS